MAEAKAPVVIVTRPEREAESWAAGLQGHGVRTEMLPLIQITALPDASALQAVWLQMPQQSAVMFVSANAVRFFMAAKPDGVDVPACRAWSTGPGTQAALLACGWPAEQIDSPDADSGSFDSEALWGLVSARVASWAHASVLIVRGADAQGQMAGRDWLAHQLSEAGVPVTQVVAYVRQTPLLSVSQRQRAKQAMTDGSWWLFSSSEAAQHLLLACPDLDVTQAQAMATHPRIAQRLSRFGWGRVETVPPELAAQAVSIKSLS